MEFGVAAEQFQMEYFDLMHKINGDLNQLIYDQREMIERIGQSYMEECADIAINIYDCDEDCVNFYTSDLR